MSQSIDSLISQLNTVDQNNPDLQWQACTTLGKNQRRAEDQKMISEQLLWSEQNNRRIIILLRNHDVHTHIQPTKKDYKSPPGRL
jgi:hypothetical protein